MTSRSLALVAVGLIGLVLLSGSMKVGEDPDEIKARRIVLTSEDGEASIVLDVREGSPMISVS